MKWLIGRAIVWGKINENDASQPWKVTTYREREAGSGLTRPTGLWAGLITVRRCFDDGMKDRNSVSPRVRRCWASTQQCVSLNPSWKWTRSLPRRSSLIQSTNSWPIVLAFSWLADCTRVQSFLYPQKPSPCHEIVLIPKCLQDVFSFRNVE